MSFDSRFESDFMRLASAIGDSIAAFCCNAQVYLAVRQRMRLEAPKERVVAGFQGVWPKFIS
jgi:hypothetical protein